MIREVGFDTPPRVDEAIAEYRSEADVIGIFLSEHTRAEEKSRLPTSTLYSYYVAWAKDNGYRPMSNKNLVGELRRRLDVRRDGATGNVIVGLALV